ncbi:O-antigen ligase-like membrane protein [Paucimonas lemoignei]|uniref:O-antigen ligase-like membrane protein n=1 Tax=Paucimonas lemoignei TaxID=29443 RepID=A0A4R3HQ65_PAULE|nr:O-antigen ligase family protein [Paucimonas lemoignei]TCS34318.1 O-antigen ligase-like membrane protein [Paucimonas lemoignei]
MNTDVFTSTSLLPKRDVMVTWTIRPSVAFLRWYHSVAIAASLIILFSNLPIYSYILLPELLPKYFFFGLFALLAPLLIVKFHTLRSYLLSPFCLWALLLIVLNVIHLSSFSADAATSAAPFINTQLNGRSDFILTRIQYVVFALLFGFAVYSCNRTSYLRVFVLLAIAIPIAIMVDFASPGLLYPIDTSGAVLGRAAAMFINPTTAAEAALLVFIFACAVVSPKYRLFLFVLMAAGILVTFTRSAIIAMAFLWVAFVYKRILPRSTILISAILLVLGVMSFGAFEAYLGNRQDLGGAIENVQARLNFFSSAELTDDSSLERAAVIRAGWEVFLQNPVFGAGAGATQFWSLRASTHNQLLLMAVEYGLLGIVLWGWLAIILWKGRFFEHRGLQLAIFFLYVFMSMFTHLMLDSASYWLATFALASLRRDGAGMRYREMA